MSEVLELSEPVSIENFQSLQMVRRPRWLGVAARCIAGLLIVIPVCLLFVPWRQNFKCTGRVVAFTPFDRQQSIDAPVGGRVAKSWVQEGSLVRAGDPLVEITDLDPGLLEKFERERRAIQGKYDAARDKLSAFEQQAANLESTRDLAVAAAKFRVDMAVEKVKSSIASKEASHAALKAAEAQLARHKKLLSDGLVSRRDFEVAERDEEMARTTVTAAIASLASSENELLATRTELERLRAESDARVDSARAAVNDSRGQMQEALASLAKIDVDITRQQSQRIHAPRDGVVFRLLASLDGQIVKAGDPLLELVPTTSNRSVELWLDGNDAPLVQAGAAVRLQFEGWPAVQFAGWPSVAVGTFGGRVALIDSTDNGQGQFRVLVTPDPNEPEWPEARYLRQGVRAKGWVLLNRVTLGYEVWRQLNGFPPVIASAEPGAAPQKVTKPASK